MIPLDPRPPRTLRARIGAALAAAVVVLGLGFVILKDTGMVHGTLPVEMIPTTTTAPCDPAGSA